MEPFDTDIGGEGVVVWLWLVVKDLSRFLVSVPFLAT